VNHIHGNAMLQLPVVWFTPSHQIILHI